MARDLRRRKFLGLLLPLVFCCYLLSQLLNPAGDGQKCPAAFPVVGTDGEIVSAVNMEKLIPDWVVSCSEREWGHSRENPPLVYLKA